MRPLFGTLLRTLYLLTCSTPTTPISPVKQLGYHSVWTPSCFAGPTLGCPRPKVEVPKSSIISLVSLPLFRPSSTDSVQLKTSPRVNSPNTRYRSRQYTGSARRSFKGRWSKARGRARSPLYQLESVCSDETGGVCSSICFFLVSFTLMAWFRLIVGAGIVSRLDVSQCS